MFLEIVKKINTEKISEIHFYEVIKMLNSLNLNFNFLCLEAITV